MGLLDDAIRDHLDLKRRRGADPAEVERAEREALGPVRRQPEAAEDEFGYAAEPMRAADAVGVGDEDALYTEDPTAYGDVQDDAGWPEAVPGAVAQDQAPPPHGARWAPDDEAFDEPEPGMDTKPHETVAPDPGALPPRPRRVGEETAEYDVEGENRASEGENRAGDGENRAGDGREDVLEETPEFLQDTPDHDRLWFEQRPPRDFNFDS